MERSFDDWSFHAIGGLGNGPDVFGLSLGPTKLADRPNAPLVVVAASCMALALGSVHAFSVFIGPLEQLFGASRSQVSLTYSLALVTLTLAVLGSHRLASRWPPWVFVAFVGATAAFGCFIAAMATDLAIVWLGYSLIFGAANGLGYAFGLQFAGQSWPGNEGKAMGIVTAAYAIGATISPPLLVFAMGAGGFARAMVIQGSALLVFSGSAAWLLKSSPTSFRTEQAADKNSRASLQVVAVWWLGYGTAVAAGLMAIGHSAEIARGLIFELSWIAPMTVALMNMFGSFTGGYLVDRFPLRRLLVALPIVTTTSLVALATASTPTLTLICLGLIGMAYGAVISIYPAAIAKSFGIAASTRIYGQVFTAWGLAGLLAPWFAGRLFDLHGDYRMALLLAALLSLISSATMFLHRPNSKSPKFQ